MVKPKILVLFTSYLCNSQCIMCYTWKKQNSSRQLSINDLESMLNDKILSSALEIVNVTGGEPTLRPDLVEIVDLIVHKCKKLKRIDMPTNGINTEQIIDKIESILALLLPTDVKLSVTVSLDGIEGVHEKIRGIQGCFSKVEKTIKEIKELQSIWPEFSFGLNATINKLNYNNLDQLKEYAVKQNIGMNYTLGAISEIGVESVHMLNKFHIDSQISGEVIKFFESNARDNFIKQDYAELVINLLKNGKRKPVCAFKSKKAILVEPDGRTYMCGNFKEFFIGNILEKPFEKISRNISHIKNNQWKRCLTCESNCYIEEALR